MTETRTIARLAKPFDVAVALPGSKSIALRQLVISALAEAPSTLLGVPRCDDVDEMTAALRRFGVDLAETGPSRIAVAPPRGFRAGEIHVRLGLSGVSLRLLLALAALRPDATHINGDAPLRARPNHDLIDALDELGCHTIAVDGGHLPITVRGPAVPETAVSVGTSVSSQPLSGLLLVAPKLPQGLTIHLKDDLVSAPYVEITRNEMARRGVAVETLGERSLRVESQRYGGGTIDH